MGLAGPFTPAALCPPVAATCGRGTKDYVEKGQKSSDIGAVIILSRLLLACWLIADVPYLVLQSPP